MKYRHVMEMMETVEFLSKIRFRPDTFNLVTTRMERKPRLERKPFQERRAVGFVFFDREG